MSNKKLYDEEKIIEMLEELPTATGEPLKPDTRKKTEEEIITEKLTATYKQQQKNIVKSEATRAELLKSIKAGNNIYNLFLQAVNCISLMTGDALYYEQAKKDICAIYGKGFLNTEPLGIEIAETKRRLDKLKTACKNENETPDSLTRLQAAIKKHTQQVDYMTAKLAEQNKEKNITTQKGKENDTL